MAGNCSATLQMRTDCFANVDKKPGRKMGIEPGGKPATMQLVNGLRSCLLDLGARLGYRQIEPCPESLSLHARGQRVDFKEFPKNPLQAFDASAPDIHLNRLKPSGTKFTQPRIIVELHSPA